MGSEGEVRPKSREVWEGAGEMGNIGEGGAGWDIGTGVEGVGVEERERP